MSPDRNDQDWKVPWPKRPDRIGSDRNGQTKKVCSGMDHYLLYHCIGSSIQCWLQFQLRAPAV